MRERLFSLALVFDRKSRKAEFPIPYRERMNQNREWEIHDF